MKKFFTHPLVIAHIILILLVGGFFVAKILAWPAYKEWQNQRLITQASELIESESYEKAYLAIRKVIIQSDDPEAWNLALTIAEQVPEKYEVIPQLLSKLIQLEPQNPKHVQKLCLIALGIGQNEIAKQTFAKYPEDQRDTGTYHSLGYQIAIRDKDTDQAILHLQALQKLDPENNEFNYLLSALNIQNESELVQSQAKEKLETLTENPKMRFPALRALLGHAILQKDEQEALKYARQILASDSISLGDRLSAMEAFQLFKKDEVPALLNTLKENNYSTAAQHYLILEFFLKYQMFNDAKAWIANIPEELSADPVLAPKIAQVFYLTQDWAMLKKALANSQWGEKDYGRFLLLALASRAQQDEFAFQDNWEKALLATNNDPDILKMIIDQILRWNWKKEAFEVMEKLYKQNPQDDKLYSALTAFYLNTNKTPELIRHLQLRLEYKPDDIIAKNNLALISIIKGQNLSSSFAYARANHEAEPDDPSFRTTWVLALILQDRIEEALLEIEKISPEDRRHPQRCIYLAYAYYKTGKLDEANQLLKESEPKPIFKEEQDILQETRSAISELQETENPM